MLTENGVLSMFLHVHQVIVLQFWSWPNVLHILVLVPSAGVLVV